MKFSREIVTSSSNKDDDDDDEHSKLERKKISMDEMQNH